jgi:hypothetical protein
MSMSRDPLHIRWRKEYREKRYMEHLKVEQPHQRAGDGMTNLIELAPEGKFGAIPFDGEGAEWYRKWTHVVERFQLRFGPILLLLRESLPAEKIRVRPHDREHRCRTRAERPRSARRSAILYNDN